MTTERIKQIQKETAHPESVSVQQALLKVWNECQQEKGYSKKDMIDFACKVFNENYKKDMSFRARAEKVINEFKPLTKIN